MIEAGVSVVEMRSKRAVMAQKELKNFVWLGYKPYKLSFWLLPKDWLLVND